MKGSFRAAFAITVLFLQAFALLAVCSCDPEATSSAGDCHGRTTGQATGDPKATLAAPCCCDGNAAAASSDVFEVVSPAPPRPSTPTAAVLPSTQPPSPGTRLRAPSRPAARTPLRI